MKTYFIRPFLLMVSLILSTGLSTSLAAKTKGEAFIDKYMFNLTQLTFEGDNGEAYFSFSGKELIYQSSRGGEKCDKIWMMNIDGSAKRMVSPSSGAHTCSFFYPDGEKIVFASTSHLVGDCPPKPELPRKLRYAWPLYPYDIYAANRDGSSLQRLTLNPEYDAEPIISSDGKKIVFGSKREGNFDIYIMDSDGKNTKRLTHTYGYDGGPWFSPDGKKIAWRAWHPSTKEGKAQWAENMKFNYITSTPLDIWVMNSDGSNKLRLTNNGATNWAPSWHPDGKRIIFSSNMDDWNERYKGYGHNFEIYMVEVHSGEIERLTYNKVFDSFPMFSPDGKKIVFGSNRNAKNPRSTDIFIADWFEDAFTRE